MDAPPIPTVDPSKGVGGFVLISCLLFRFVCVLFGVLSFPFSAHRSGIGLETGLSFLCCVLLVLNWPNGVSEVSICSFDVLGCGYSVSLDCTLVGLYLSLIVDLLTWICSNYSRYYISSSVDECSLLLFYVVSVLFFCSNDLMLTAVLFEYQNIPLLLLLTSRYYQPSKILNPSLWAMKGIGMASFLLLVYGLISGVFLFYGFQSLYHYSYCNTLLESIEICSGLGCCDWVMVFLIFVSGGIKLALFPFHVWLGKVHVEAPTIGSVLLAGVALKSGFYVHYLFWGLFGSLSGIGLLFGSLMLGGFYSSLSLFFQVDMKSWVALFSISHMNLFYLMGFTVLAGNSVVDSSCSVITYGMLGHSFISGALFVMIGYVADLCGSKYLHDTFPVVSYQFRWVLFLFLLANSAFPLLFLFVFEFLAYTQMLHFNTYLTLFGLLCSSTCLLSSMFISSKYIPAQTSMGDASDSMIIALCSPLLLISVLCGIQFLMPIGFLVF